MKSVTIPATTTAAIIATVTVMEAHNYVLHIAASLTVRRKGMPHQRSHRSKDIKLISVCPPEHDESIASVLVTLSACQTRTNATGILLHFLFRDHQASSRHARFSAASYLVNLKTLASGNISAMQSSGKVDNFTGCRYDGKFQLSLPPDRHTFKLKLHRTTILANTILFSSSNGCIIYKALISF